MTWFQDLTGFPEKAPDQVRSNLSLKGSTLTSKANGRELICGCLETPTLAELRKRLSSVKRGTRKITIRELVADTQVLHVDPANAGALFQVASQFNLLEMVSPKVTPEQGVGIYERDFTQGPACAIAAGAGTIYRNYFAPVNGRIGQTAENQIDCLEDIGKALGNTDGRLWQMRNGYALPSRDGLVEIFNRLQLLGEDERDELRKLLRIGIQWNTQVTLNTSSYLVSQAYCSALPVAYSAFSVDLWQPFAQLVLEASYEATICAAILNRESTGNNDVYLTLIGGGAFGNETDWIIEAIQRVLTLYADYAINVIMVSYGRSKSHVRQLVSEFS
ncbi:hypothetical protein [Candidatus Electrothrix sp.]|uniref:hypothetical protein n=1 Tax=Candidatus Electrothrix sp. TaxID=2170559 RepID=UPI00405778F5